MSNNAIAIHQRRDVSLGNFTEMRQQAEVLVKSGFLPCDINTPEKAIAVMMTGAELNIPPMQALRQITIIQGKPTVSPELMAALVERDFGPNAMIVEHTTDDQCVVSCLKPGWDKRRTVEFTIEDATRAELTSGSNSHSWRKYPVAMLRSRAISIACKTYFQASIGGMYTGEELGAAVDVVDGDVVVHDHAAVHPAVAGPVVHPEATPRQIKYLHAVAHEIGLTHDDLHGLSMERFGIGIAELNRRQAPELIEHIQARRPLSPLADARASAVAVQADTEVIDHEPSDDMPDFAEVERTEILADLPKLSDKRDLAGYRERISNANLDDDRDVERAYKLAYRRLHNERPDPSENDAQAVLQGVN